MSSKTVNDYSVKIDAEYVHVGEYGPNKGVHPHRIVVRGTWANMVLAECVGNCQWESCREHKDGAQITLSGFGWSPINPKWELVQS